MPYYNKNYQNLPKKPVKSFMDLEVYQKALEVNVFACNTIIKAYNDNLAVGQKKKKQSKMIILTGVIDAKEAIIKNLLICSASIPHLIAEAHSYRFGSQTTCLILLEKVMLNCNKMAVYIEQVRDICQIPLEHEQYEELIKKYLYIRRKVLNLQRSWKKYMRPAAEVDRG